ACSLAVVGAGNVALDIARFLAKSSDELSTTDLPDHVLGVLQDSKVQDIHVIARRGPAQAKFTTKELREFGDLDNADVLVDPADVDLDDSSRELIDSRPVARRNVEALRSWAERKPAGRPREVRFWFWHRPMEILGRTGVTGLRLECTRLDESGHAVGTGETCTLAVQMVFRSVGYRGRAFPGLPFDDEAGIVPNEAGRVLRDGAAVPGEYVAGWIKRGPTGVIGTNKRDANETVASLLADAGSLPRAAQRDPDALVDLLGSRGVRVVDWPGWSAIEQAEAELGRTQGRERTKIV